MGVRMEQRKAELFRRPRKNLYTDYSTRNLGKGSYRSYRLILRFPTPGWIAFDFAASVQHDTMQTVDKGEFHLRVDGETKFAARGSYTWERQYIFVDKGKHIFIWQTNEDYKDDDESWLRHIVATAFEPVEELAAIGDISPPKPKINIHRMDILNGRDRYQRTGQRGTEIDFTGYFLSPEEMNLFFDDFPNFYVLKYSGGLYGGIIIPQDSEFKREGRVYINDFTFQSAQLPGDRMTNL